MSDMPPPPPEFEPGSSSQPPPPPEPPAQSAQATKGWATTDTGQSVELAGAGSRLLARIVDILIFAVPVLVWAIATTAFDDNSDEAAGVPLGFTLLFLAIGLIYEVWMIAAKGQTLGKMATRIKVIRADNGELPGWSNSFNRWILPGFFGAVGAFIQAVGLVSPLIYLSLLWGKNRQGWHDMVAKTLVVKA